MEPAANLPTIVLNELIGNSPPQLNTLQSFLLPYTEPLVVFWWFVWFVTAIVLIRYVYIHGVRDSAMPKQTPVD